MIPLIGYVDQLSGRPSDSLSFMVSSQCKENFDVQLVKIICADPNPAGPGIIQHEIDSTINASYPSRQQPFYPGSYATTEHKIEFQDDESFSLVASIFPTLPGQTEQTIISVGDAALYILPRHPYMSYSGSQENLRSRRGLPLMNVTTKFLND